MIYKYYDLLILIRMLSMIFLFMIGIIKAMMRVSLKEQIELHELYVDPFFIYQGIGSLMLQYLIKKNQNIEL